MYVMSATHSRFGPATAKFRSTKSGARRGLPAYVLSRPAR